MVDKLGQRPDYLGDEDVNPSAPDAGFKPQIKLISALNDELVEGDDKYVKGLKAGDLYITSGTVNGIAAEGKIIPGKKGLRVIPIMDTQVWVEYKPSRGGFVKRHESPEAAKSDRASSANDIVHTIEYGMALPDYTHEEGNLAILSLSGWAKQGAAETLAKSIQEYRTYAGVTYKLTSKAKKNKDKKNYFMLVVDPVDYTPKKNLLVYNEFRKQAVLLAAPEEDSEI